MVSQINSSSNNIPFAEKSFDRIIALESAPHFVPLEKFFGEARRVLSDDGKLILAIPVTRDSSAVRIGILSITWLSKKYTENHVLDVVKQAGFSLKNQESVGNLVYEPFANYYIQNRDSLKEKLVSTYSGNVENLTFKSMKKMKELSEKKVIDYLLLSLQKDFFGQDRLQCVYPLRSLIERGIVAGLSSDAPVIDPNPLTGIYFAVTRKTPTGQTIAPHEAVSVLQAIRAYTMSVAYATFEEQIKGSLEPGKLADLVILSEDILKTSPEKILSIKADLPMVDGKVVYERNAQR